MILVKKIKSLLVAKTGQTVEYLFPDDGTFQTGWWSKRNISNNRSRYTTKTIGGDLIVFDKATGLVWPGDGDEAGSNNASTLTWSNAFAYAEGLTFAGYSDWRIPNIKEIHSLAKIDYNTWFAGNSSVDSPPFLRIARAFYWGSTTDPTDTNGAFGVDFLLGLISGSLKSSPRRLLCVRGGL